MSNDGGSKVLEARYEIPIYAGESLVVRAGRYRSRILICRGEPPQTLSSKGLLHLAGRPVIVVHFIDRSLPSGGFRHDAVKISFQAGGPTVERIEAPPRVPPDARAIEVSRLARQDGMIFPIRKA